MGSFKPDFVEGVSQRRKVLATDVIKAGDFHSLRACLVLLTQEVTMKWAFLTIVFTTLFANSSRAATYFINDAVIENGVSAQDGRAATTLVKNAVAGRYGDAVVNDQSRASYTLQPRLMRLGESYILTVEKSRGDETLFAAQTKISRIDQLDQAARSMANEAIEEPSGKNSKLVQIVVDPRARQGNGSTSGTTMKPDGADIYGTTPELSDQGRKVSYWTLGFGPTFATRLKDDSVMYNFSAGRVWDINPKAEIKLIGEANLSSGDRSAKLFNLGVGPNFFLPEMSADTAPYLTADIGYGVAENADGDTANGFSIGAGAGFQFFRTTQTTMDLVVRYTTVLDTVGRGEKNPSVLGARLAVNF
jgi:hypothetical protein